MIDPSEITESTIKQHYSYQPVGSILYQGCPPCNHSVTNTESDFEYIFEAIEARAQALHRTEEHNDRETLLQALLLRLVPPFVNRFQIRTFH